MRIRDDTLASWIIPVLIAVMVVCTGRRQPTADDGDTSPLFVASTVPAALAGNVTITTNIVVTLNKQLDSSTISTSTFALKQDTLSILGSFTYADSAATFNPVNDLAPNTTYAVTITTEVTDLAGNAMAENYTWRFTTGSIPKVIYTSPANNESDVALNRYISATFDEVMDSSTISTATFTFQQDSTLLPGSVVYSGTTAAFVPETPFTPNTLYSATITTGARNTAGNAMPTSRTWSFVAGIMADTIQPSVNSMFPANAALDVAINKHISVAFSELMDWSTITTETFSLLQDTARVAGTVSYSGPILTFSPSENLRSNAQYSAMIVLGIRDRAANPLPQSYEWQFTTGSDISGQPSLDLGTAQDFSVLSGAAIINEGTSFVTGNMGIHPGQSTQGLSLIQLAGALHVNNTTSASAQTDLAAAFHDAAERNTEPVTISGNLADLFLVPGLYKSISGIEISSGDLTLNARGDPNAVFIFQIASKLVTSTGSQIVLTGSASALNVFWQIDGNVILGDSSVFEGTILSSKSITMGNRASLNGSALSLNDTVFLNSNTIWPRTNNHILMRVL